MPDSDGQGTRKGYTASVPVIVLILVVGVGGGFAADYLLDGPLRAVGVFAAIILAFALALLLRRPLSRTK